MRPDRITEARTEAGFLPRAGFQALLDALRQSGYRCVGPQPRDGAIVYGALAGVDMTLHGIDIDPCNASFSLSKAVRRVLPQLIRDVEREAIDLLKRDRPGASVSDQTRRMAQ